MFAEHNVTGDILLALEHDDLKQDFGVKSALSRGKLLKAIQALVQQCPPDAASSRPFALKSQPHQRLVFLKMLNDSWHKPGERVKTVTNVLEIQNPSLARRYKEYCAKVLGEDANEMVLFHGVQDTCGGHGCSEGIPRCGACGIPSEGFRLSVADADKFQRFGNGVYFAKDSSKSHGSFVS